MSGPAPRAGFSSRRLAEEHRSKPSTCRPAFRSGYPRPMDEVDVHKRPSVPCRMEDPGAPWIAPAGMPAVLKGSGRPMPDPNPRPIRGPSPGLDLAPELFQFEPSLLGGDKFGLSARKGARGSVKRDAVTSKELRVAHDRLQARDLGFKRPASSCRCHLAQRCRCARRVRCGSKSRAPPGRSRSSW
jgi:hypothetical protein